MHLTNCHNLSYIIKYHKRQTKLLSWKHIVCTFEIILTWTITNSNTVYTGVPSSECPQNVLL